MSNDFVFISFEAHVNPFPPSNSSNLSIEKSICFAYRRPLNFLVEIIAIM